MGAIRGREERVCDSGIDFSSDTDVDLLGYMALAEDDQQAGQEAFGEFYRRHRDWLAKMLSLSEVGRLVGGHREIGDVVSETFRRAYEGARTFVADESCAKDGGCRRARAWIGKIANNVVYDDLRLQDCAAGAEPLEELRLVPGSNPFDDPAPGSPLGRVAWEAFETLSEKERDVLLDTLLHFRLGAKQQRLPNAVSAALCKRWDTTPENIRTIRMRAMGKIRKHVEDWPGAKEFLGD